MANPIGLQLSYWRAGQTQHLKLRQTPDYVDSLLLSSCCSEELGHTDHSVLYIFIFIVQCKEICTVAELLKFPRGGPRDSGKQGMSGVQGDHCYESSLLSVSQPTTHFRQKECLMLKPPVKPGPMVGLWGRLLM